MACGEKNELVREGTSVLTRVLAALSTGYAQVDERDMPEILLFAKRYAACLNYYDDTNTATGDWQQLMQMDISVTIATLIKTDMPALSNYKKLLYKKIAIAANDADAKTQFKYLYDCIFSLISLIDQQYQLLPDDIELKEFIHHIIVDKMQLPFLITDQLFEEFKTAGWIDISLTGLSGAAPIATRSCADFKTTDLSQPEWGLLLPPPDPGVTLPGFATVRENIQYIIQHNIFTSNIDILLNGAAEMVGKASLLFDQTVEDFPNHAPHYALFLSFVKLFRHAQDQLNNYTQRHLDFYYKDILRLVNKKSEPDSAHLLFELQKPVQKHLLTKNTLFKGGKDITGREINYALTDDLVVNKATVAKIHSQQILSSGKLLGSPVANSDDGQGAEIKSADQSWFTYGDTKKSAFAKTGFAIASNLLFLNEGTRTVNILAKFGGSAIPSFVKQKIINVSDCFSARVTGKKDWVAINHLTVITDTSEDLLLFSFTLAPDDPAVVPYLESIHKANFNTPLPLLQIFLKQDLSDKITYLPFCKKKLTSLVLTVSVRNVKDLILSNDAGSIDASAPFKPFGEFPENGCSFYIGSREIFQKNLTSLTLNFNWRPVYNEITNAYIIPNFNKQVSYLNQASWNQQYPIDASNHVNFSTNPFINKKAAINFDKTQTLAPNSIEGFLRFRLADTRFSLRSHMANVNTRLNKTTMTKSGDVFSLAMEPVPTPMEIFLDDFSLDYTASETITFNPSHNNLFYHLGPFGYSLVDKSLFDNNTRAEKTQPLTLIPDCIHEGELYVGFDQAQPNLVINVLFQVAEGSSNPLKNMETLQWYYLSDNNNWREFEKQFVIDRTRNFTGSGIVTFTLPPDISKDITLLEPGLHWIKTTVTQNCDAVCKMIMISAQAGLVTLVQDQINLIEFHSTLPAGRITKLLAGDALVKTISQPFDSFNGRTRETDENFYLRVSERLRHKQRAITIWDYEHIVLEEFPAIFKVKCINHSGFYPKGNGEIFCENYPGHVTVVTIPDQQGKSNINPLRPYTPIGLLQDVNDYLLKIISPFVKLHVKNPLFEQIQFDFQVKFYDNLDESFYLQLLNDEIEKFLCPWAFQANTEISFGGTLSKSAVLNFVEERSYVDFVTFFKMNQYISDPVSGLSETKNDIEVAEGTTSRSILVSYYNEDTGEKHKIISPASCD
ncbi:MAG TPA: hypothetical protein VGH64_04905 [Puia sp.]|jgi:hypothetical protein